MIDFKTNFLLVILLFSLSSCNSTENEPQVITVSGAMSASEMGTTLIHEHVLVDWIGADSTGYHRWDGTEVVNKTLPFFKEARQSGVETILDCTPAYLGRDPFVLEELSRQSGIRILTNTGFYGAVDNTYMPELARQETAEEIAGRWIGEFQNGIDGSNIKPGFMKISVAERQPLSGLHQKIVLAAAIVHLETGMTIVSHTIGDEPALEQIEYLKNEGVSPSAWVWTHAQSGSLEGNIEAAGEGAWISLDGINSEANGSGNIDWYADRITELREAGLLSQILVSHDAGFYEAGEPDGGDFRGYTDIFDHLIPQLKNNNVSEDEIQQLMVENPKQAYGIRVRKF